MEDKYENLEENINNEAEEMENEKNVSKSTQPHKLEKGQKIAVAFLAIFAVVIVGIWVVQFKNNISSPFKRSNSGSSNSGTQQSYQQENEEDLRTKDTDSDGLSDWDELYLFKTSPYLEDSDSDGLSDYQEVENEKDPNCPAGRDCYGVEVVEDKSGQNNSGNNSSSQLIDNQNLNVSDNENINSILSGQGDAAALRKMLLDAGMDEKILNQFSDEDLLSSYQETLNQ